MVDIPVSRNRLSVLKRYGGNVADFFANKHAIICLEALLFLLSFTGGFSSGKTHTSDFGFVSGSHWYTEVSSPVTMYQNAWRPSSVKFAWHVGAPVHTTPLLLFTQVMGHPTGTTFPYAKAVVKNASETSR